MSDYIIDCAKCKANCIQAGYAIKGIKCPDYTDGKATRPVDSSGSTEFTGCMAKEVLAKLLYPDVESVDAYECGGCKEEFSIGTEPNNCPRCGVKFTRVGVF